MSNEDVNFNMIETETADKLDKYPIIDPCATFSTEEMDKLTIAFKKMITDHAPSQSLVRFPEYSDIIQGLFERSNYANKRFNPQHHIDRAMSGEYKEKKQEAVLKQWTEERDAMISRARLTWVKQNAERWLTNEVAYHINVMNTRPTESFEQLQETSPIEFQVLQSCGVNTHEVNTEDSMIDRLDAHRSLQKPLDWSEAQEDFKKISNLWSRNRRDKAMALLNELPEERRQQLFFYLKMAG